VPALAVSLVVFFQPFFFATALFVAAVCFADFLVIARFCTYFFASVAFLPALLLDFVDFFLLFLLLAMRAV